MKIFRNSDWLRAVRLIPNSANLCYRIANYQITNQILSTHSRGNPWDQNKLLRSNLQSLREIIFRLDTRDAGWDRRNSRLCDRHVGRHPCSRVKVRLDTAINRADFVSWWMWFNGSTTKATAEFSHECILLPSYIYNMHQDTKSARLIALCKRSFIQDW